MTSIVSKYFGERNAPYTASRAADGYERFLAAGAAALFVAVAIAVMRGYGEWHVLSPAIWAHLFTIIVALGLTPIILLRRRGDPRHRLLGWIWAGSLMVTAAVSLFIRTINDGGFSIIHILSVWTLIQVPVLVISARRHDVARHRSAVRGMVTGALLIAGFFTFPFDRILGNWLMG